MKRRVEKIIELNSEIEGVPVPIISDAAFAAVGIADGRLIPVIIIDGSFRPDVEEMINAHTLIGIGDVESGWIQPDKRNSKITLFINFLKPGKCIVLLEFDLLNNMGGVVDLIINAQGLYLQCGQLGDRLSSTMNKPRILVEVPSKSVLKDWEELYHGTTEKFFRKNGHKKAKAQKLAVELISQMRKLNKMRIRG